MLPINSLEGVSFKGVQLPFPTPHVICDFFKKKNTKHCGSIGLPELDRQKDPEDSLSYCLWAFFSLPVFGEALSFSAIFSYFISCSIIWGEGSFHYWLTLCSQRDYSVFSHLLLAWLQNCNNKEWAIVCAAYRKPVTNSPPFWSRN